MPTYEAPLSIIDQNMPCMNVSMWLIFSTDDPGAAAIALQKGLDATISQLPFLSGTVFEKEDAGNRSYVTWSDDAPKVTFEEIDGKSLPSYSELCETSMNVAAYARDLMPTSLKVSRKTRKWPALVASFVRLSGGIMVLFAPHHHIVDGGGRTILFKLFASHTKGLRATTAVAAQDPLLRNERLAQAFRTINVASKPAESPASPPAKVETPSLTQTSSPTSLRLFEFSVRRLNTLRSALSSHIEHPCTIGSLVSAVIWIEASRVRSRRLQQSNANYNADEAYTELLIAVNPRKYLEAESLLEKDSYIGNLASSISPRPHIQASDLLSAESHCFEVVLPSNDASSGRVETEVTVSIPSILVQALNQLSLGLDGRSAESFARQLSPLFDIPSSPEFDYRQLRNMRAMFAGRDMVVSNWGGFDMYLDFGKELGRPSHARLIGSGYDGAIIVLPRRYGGHWSEDLLDRLEVVLDLREDDLVEVEKSPLLRALMTPQPG